MKKQRLILAVFILLGLFPHFALGQNKTTVYIEHADYLSYNVKLGADMQRLIGHVKLRQDSTLFYCDSAYLNGKKRNFEAFGNVHIVVSDTVNVYGNRMHYEGKTRVAELFGNVKLVDNKTVLTTDHLVYNRITQIAFYTTGGIIVSDSNRLTSKKGYYNTITKIFYFRINVVLKNPNTETYSDTLIYNSGTKTAFFEGPTVIRGKESTIYCEKGWYNTEKGLSKITRRPSIWSNEQSITADSLNYNNATYYGEAFGNVEILDTSHNILIKGHLGKMWDKKGLSYVTDSAIAITYDDEDSMFVHADTLFMYFDKNRQAKKMLAYYKVRFYRKDLQGKCDSLAYSMKDSTIRMFRKPVLWSGKNQLSADTIVIAITRNQVDSLILTNKAFIVSRDSTDTFNQIKGKNMVGHFKDNELETIDVDGNAESVYYVRDDDKYLVGVNKEEASFMIIRLRNDEISNISYLEHVSVVMYPEKDVPNEVKRLKGFDWKVEQRPKNKWDIFWKNGVEKMKE